MNFWGTCYELLECVINFKTRTNKNVVFVISPVADPKCGSNYLMKEKERNLRRITNWIRQWSMSISSCDFSTTFQYSAYVVQKVIFKEKSYDCCWSHNSERVLCMALSLQW